MLTAVTLLVALGLDNTAVGGSVAGSWRPWLRVTGVLGVVALTLAVGGALVGHLVRMWLNGWAQLMGATLLFALTVDAVRGATSARVSPEEVEEDGPAWRRAMSGLLGNLDEFGVGFAFGGSLHTLGLWPWGLSCLGETAAALMAGFALRRWLGDGRRLAPWNAVALFVGCGVLLVAFPVNGPHTPY